MQLGVLPRVSVSISISELGLGEGTGIGSQCFETELDEAPELLAEHPYLALVISRDYPTQEAEAVFAMALDLIDPSKILVKVGALGA